VIVAPPRPIEVLDEAGRSVVVTERGMIPLPPARVAPGDNSGDAGLRRVTAWAGPWPVDERWWDQQAREQWVRMQLVDAAGRAYLVCFDVRQRGWFLEGIYD
jgi:protein ImuB